MWRLILASRLGLGDDEGYYWDWQNHLSAGYFDHPPLVAWLIWLGQTVLPKAEWAVRLPFVLLAMPFAWLLLQLSRRLGSPFPGRNTVTVIALVPLFSFGSFMAFPDIPMLGAWLWALFLCFRIKDEPKAARLWALLGLACGLALLSKLTALILVVSVGAWILTWSHLRREILTYRFWLALLIALGLILPPTVWNWHHGFPMLRFQLVVRQSHANFSAVRELRFVVSQVLLLSPLIFMGCTQNLALAWRERTSERGRWVLCFSLPALAIFFVQPFKASFQPHWPAPAYLPLLAMGVFPRSSYGRLSQTANSVYLFTVNLLFLAILSFPLIPAANSILHFVSPWKANYDISSDFYGWPEGGKWINGLLSEFAKKGKEPRLMTSRYQLAGNLSFYTDGLATAIGERANAYRYFEYFPNPELAPLQSETEAGPILFVADNRYRDTPMQSKSIRDCRSLGSIEVNRWQYPARTFTAWYCSGFDSKER